MNKRPLKIALIVLVGLVCGAGIILGYNRFVPSIGLDIPGAETAPGARFTDVVAAPDRLLIPKIGVDAHVKAVGTDANGDMATPGNATDVAWYQHGPHPGMPGSAVVDGHLNTKYEPRAVFYNLGQLQPGDEVQLRTVDGQMLIFRVIKIQKYAHNSPTEDIFKSQGDTPYLNLITCTGDWDPVKKIYSERVVVFTERIS